MVCILEKKCLTEKCIAVAAILILAEVQNIKVITPIIHAGFCCVFYAVYIGVRDMQLKSSGNSEGGETGISMHYLVTTNEYEEFNFIPKPLRIILSKVFKVVNVFLNQTLRI